jgi:beta-galactosidase
MERLLYGAAYYDEYMPYERLQEDIHMMKEAGINVVRIAESTWSTEESQEGVFDFSHVTKVLDAMQEAGICVIVGTPTYAIPVWMAKKYPEVMVMNSTGQRRPYGARQIMDITNKEYRFFAERIIRKLMEAVQRYSCVIGFQLDNETKHYGTCSANVQEMFAVSMKKKYEGDLEQLNQDFGLAYWSNRINTWDEFPSVIGTINGSLGCAFASFQRSLVTEYLDCQRRIVEEYRRPEQFVTHNFDFEWRGYSFGVQPDVDHYETAKCVTRAGCDIYHPTQEHLTGKEIGFCGDLARSLKRDNYFVMETQAQGFPNWTPFDGQLRLQAFSHLASGADAVMYWHWHSIHNACETYWKGVLSHNLKENAAYLEVKRIGEEFHRLSHKLIHLKKENQAAIMVSNESLTALEWFPFAPGQKTARKYNDIVRWIYDALFELNAECDIINSKEMDLSRYSVIFVPAMYSASEEVLNRLKSYVEDGGCLVGTFKTGFTDENIKVRTGDQPYLLRECFGVTYDQFTLPENVSVEDDLFVLEPQDRRAELFMELLQPEGARVLASYGHDNWGKYAAITENSFGKGKAVYLGCMTSAAYLKALLIKVLSEAGVKEAAPESEYPIVIRKGLNQQGNEITYYLNYSGEDKWVPVKAGVELFTGREVEPGEVIIIEKWNLVIIESMTL